MALVWVVLNHMTLAHSAPANTPVKAARTVSSGPLRVATARYTLPNLI
jgi:hypothetical protein